MQLYELLEITMLLCFGCSWPFNIMKSYRVRTTTGKSLGFLILIMVGYGVGILSKLVNPNGYHWYVMMFYVLDLTLVSIDFVLYFRNRRLDRLAGRL